VKTVTQVYLGLRWWMRLLAVAALRGPGYMCVAAAVVWLTLPWGGVIAVAASLALIVGQVATQSHPARLLRWFGPVLGQAWRWRIRRHWDEVCVSCGLARDGADTPKVRRTRADWPHVQFVVRPVLGQTTASFEAAAEALRTGVGASRLRVDTQGSRDVLLTFTVGDELRVPFDAAPGLVDEQLRWARMGKREDGKPWQLAIGPHTLVAGCSGSGKGSLFWSFAFALAPAVHGGRVQLHGIDLKGGMEIRMGEGLFTTEATNAAEAVVVLEMLVGWMRARAQLYAGHLRSHVPTVEEPLHVIMIDELAALTAYCPERDLQRRAESAINLLCSQGRAPGFMVFACLQDPRKEVIPSRGLFTQMIGLRLKDLSETAMVLGEIAVQSGAYCHRITRDVPGTGYVLPEEGGHPIRVRAGFASDESIRSVASRFPSLTRMSIVVPDSFEDERRPRRRATELI
jgi:DNA segregation ATPase FtsK/SpoIIIE, S-DNA-T family